MKIAINTTMLSDTAQRSARDTDAGSDNAFGQLLSSLERDMWSGLSQLPRNPPPAEPEMPSSIPSATTHRQRSDAPESIRGDLAPVEGFGSSATFGTTYANPIRTTPDIARAEVRAERHFPSPSGDVRTDFTAPPPPLYRDRRDAPQSESRRPQPGPSKEAAVQLDARQPASAAPFRVTVTEIAGEISIALRTHQTRPDELNTLESRATRALGRYGAHTATLCINGVERRIYVAGGEKNGH
ncbi:hypothetical protein [Burkholderia ambifaria]|uniref:hypothetical protein n=1 Tax=Burkholderia ambifaria TaxID=152480 RepID=UPI00158E3F1F|nr:hypothetical protein [Burkholderia ambifaria]